ncbi:MAG TPA: hypothetical protein VGR53_02080 [Nitrososphaerales archaeon]|nr:hypothetical protein [Nitrososphaerales archaeon]
MTSVGFVAKPEGVPGLTNATARLEYLGEVVGAAIPTAAACP